MKKSMRAALGIVAVCCCLGGLSLPSAYGANQADKKEIVRQARQAYYNLRSSGLVQFQAKLQPNWRVLLKDQDPAKAAESVKVLEGLHFSMSLDDKGAVKVLHRVDASVADDKRFTDAFGQIIGGMEQMTTGFFDTWSPFMLTSAFPAVESEYQLEDKGDVYLLSYKDGNDSVETTLSKFLVILEIKVTDPTFRSSIKPQFKTSSHGFVLTGYESTYVGTTNADHVQLSVSIDNQEVSQMQLPRQLNLSGTSQGTPFAVELAISEYQVNNH